GHRENGADRQRVRLGRNALGIEHRNARLQVRTLRGRAPIDDDFRRDAGGFVELVTDGHAIRQILEANLAGHFGEDRRRVRIPLGDAIAALDLRFLVNAKAGAERRLEGLTLLAVVIDNRDLHVAAHHDEIALGVLHGVAVDELHRAVVRRFHDGRFSQLSRTADVERAHRELGARLTDRLRRDDADSFADIHLRVAREVTAIAGAADARARFAGQHRADLNGLHARLFDHRDGVFIEEGARRHDLLACARIVDRQSRRTAENAGAERHDNVGAIDDRGHLDAVLGAAIFFGDDAVLRDVDETAREVTRVRGLQRGVREALTGAVGGVEVFENREALFEVRDDRRLDDFTRRLGHQATHAGEL